MKGNGLLIFAVIAVVLGASSVILLTQNINEKNIVFSCGSGVTACVLALAYSLINDKYHPCIYDGSWAEYGII